jgi:hypothetical protein
MTSGNAASTAQRLRRGKLARRELAKLRVEARNAEAMKKQKEELETRVYSSHLQLADSADLVSQVRQLEAHLAAAQANVKSLEESIAATQAKGSDSAKLRSELAAMEDRLGALEEELRYAVVFLCGLGLAPVHLARRHKSGVAQQLHTQKTKLEQDMSARKQEVEEERKQMQAMIAQLTESLNAETTTTKAQVRVTQFRRA